MAAAKSPGLSILLTSAKPVNTEKCMEDGRSQQAVECGILIFWG